MKKIGKVFVFFTLLFFSSSLFGVEKISVLGTVSGNPVSAGVPFEFTISVSSPDSVSVSEPRLPDLGTLSLEQKMTSSSSQAIQTDEGLSISITKSYIFTLIAPRPGDYKIEPAQIVVNGEAFLTKPILLKAVQGSAPSRPSQAPQWRGGVPNQDLEGEDIDVFSQLLRRFPRSGMGQRPQQQAINPDEAFFIQLDIDKIEAYVGEQITASFYLYTRGNLREFDVLKYPSLKGFWKEDIELATALNFQNDVINGVVYRKALIASYALFPIKAGTLVVDSMKAKATVSLESDFGFGFGRAYTYTKASRPVTIKAQEIPKEGLPADFTGAVGAFDVSAQLDQSTVPVNQPLSLRIKIKGQGNAKLIELPSLSLPAGIEIYDTKKDGKFFKDGTSVKDFEVLLIPREPGAVTIAPLTFSMFNPQTRSYYRQTTPEMKFTVTGAASAPTQAKVDAFKSSGETKAEATPFQPSVVFAWSNTANLVSVVTSPLSYLSILGLWLLGLIAKIWLEFGRDQRKVSLRKHLREKVKMAQKLANKSQFREANTQLLNNVYSVLGILSGQGGAHREIEAMLQFCPPSVRRELGDELRALVGELQSLAFAPEELVKADLNLKKVKESSKRVSQLLESAIDLGLDQGTVLRDS